MSLTKECGERTSLTGREYTTTLMVRFTGESTSMVSSTDKGSTYSLTVLFSRANGK